MANTLIPVIIFTVFFGLISGSARQLFDDKVSYEPREISEDFDRIHRRQRDTSVVKIKPFGSPAHKKVKEITKKAENIKTQIDEITENFANTLKSEMNDLRRIKMLTPLKLNKKGEVIVKTKNSGKSKSQELKAKKSKVNKGKSKSSQIKDKHRKKPSKEKNKLKSKKTKSKSSEKSRESKKKSEKTSIKKLHDKEVEIKNGVKDIKKKLDEFMASEHRRKQKGGNLESINRYQKHHHINQVKKTTSKPESKNAATKNTSATGKNKNVVIKTNKSAENTNVATKPNKSAKNTNVGTKPNKSAENTNVVSKPKPQTKPTTPVKAVNQNVKGNNKEVDVSMERLYGLDSPLYKQLLKLQAVMLGILDYMENNRVKIKDKFLLSHPHARKLHRGTSLYDNKFNQKLKSVLRKMKKIDNTIAKENQKIGY